MELDKFKIINFMLRYNCGHANAWPRAEISKCLSMDDRYFRDLCAEIPEIITSEKFGYYILPLVDTTGEETKFARTAVNNGDMRKKCITMYLRMRKQRQAIKKMQDAERQMTLAGI